MRCLLWFDVVVLCCLMKSCVCWCGWFFVLYLIVWIIFVVNY